MSKGVVNIDSIEVMGNDDVDYQVGWRVEVWWCTNLDIGRLGKIVVARKYFDLMI